MTKNQLDYVLGTQNAANERAKVQETIRNNLVLAAQADRAQQEVGRHNLATEGLSRDQNRETRRSNKAREKETKRHDKATEKNQRYDTSQRSKSSKYSADTSAAASQFAANMGLEGAKLSASASRYSAELSSGASKYAAELKTKVDRAIAKGNNLTQKDIAELQRKTNLQIKDQDVLLAKKNLDQRERQWAEQYKAQLLQIQSALASSKYGAELGALSRVIGNVTSSISQLDRTAQSQARLDTGNNIDPYEYAKLY